MVFKDFHKSIRQIIIRLDLHYLQDEFIPSLVRSHFAGNASQYRIQVVDGEGSRLIYGSDGAAAVTEGDASESIFGLNPAEYKNLVPAAVPIAARGDASVRIA
jgi:hypothetical protein